MKIYAVRQTSDSEKIFEELAEKDLWVKVRKVRGSGEVGYFKLANIDDPIAEQRAYYFNFVPAYCVHEIPSGPEMSVAVLVLEICVPVEYH